MKEKVELFPADLNNKAHICFHLLLELYHTGNAFRQNDVVRKTGASRSEVSKCVIGMIEDGLLEQVGTRKKQLTEKGYLLASAYHNRYELALTYAKAIFRDEKTAAHHAEVMALMFAEPFFHTKNLQRSSLTKKMAGYMEFDGALLCKTAASGIYPVSVSLMKILEASLPEGMHAGMGHPGAAMGHPAGMGHPAAKQKQEPLTQTEIYRFVGREQHSMADEAFLHAATIQIQKGQGVLKLHCQTIRKPSMQDGRMMEGRAHTAEYFDGTEFVACEFQGDEVLIPLEHFNFNNICGQFLGKLVIRFTCTVGEQNMPLRPAVLIMSI